MTTYKIVMMYFKGGRRTRDICPWFDGYEEE